MPPSSAWRTHSPWRPSGPVGFDRRSGADSGAMRPMARDAGGNVARFAGRIGHKRLDLLLLPVLLDDRFGSEQKDGRELRRLQVARRNKRRAAVVADPHRREPTCRYRRGEAVSSRSRRQCQADQAALRRQPGLRGRQSPAPAPVCRTGIENQFHLVPFYQGDPYSRMGCDDGLRRPLAGVHQPALAALCGHSCACAKCARRMRDIALAAADFSHGLTISPRPYSATMAAAARLAASRIFITGRRSHLDSPPPDRPRLAFAPPGAIPLGGSRYASRADRISFSRPSILPFRPVGLSGPDAVAIAYRSHQGFLCALRRPPPGLFAGFWLLRWPIMGRLLVHAVTRVPPYFLPPRPA